MPKGTTDVSTPIEVIEAVEMVFTLREIETHASDNMRNYLRRYGYYLNHFQFCTRVQN